MEKVLSVLVALALILGTVCLVSYDAELTRKVSYNGGYHRECGRAWMHCERDKTGEWFYCSRCGIEKWF